MTKTLEIRVRPVTRHVVTRYESDGLPRGVASCGTLGEFDSPARADEVALAIRASEPNARVVTSDGVVYDPIEQEFIITRVNTFEVQNEVYFANSPEEAMVLLAKLSHVPDGRDWRVFSRQKNGVVNVPPAGECSTRVYQDGTVATGPGNLPSLSPSEQACAI
jgi:hypothetical protein